MQQDQGPALPAEEDVRHRHPANAQTRLSNSLRESLHRRRKSEPAAALNNREIVRKYREEIKEIVIHDGATIQDIRGVLEERGEPVTEAGLAKALQHELGGIRAIRAGASVVRAPDPNAKKSSPAPAPDYDEAFLPKQQEAQQWLD
jgi:hypothetical protein